MVYFLCLLIIACNSTDHAANQKDQKRDSITKSLHSGSVNQSFSALLTNYYAIKDNFIAENDSLINQSAKSMGLWVDSLALDELFFDKSFLDSAKALVFGVSSELIGLVEEKQIDAKLKSFQLLSDQLYELLRIIKYDQEIIYRQYCSTAFPDQGAYWLSNSTNILNPYNPRQKRNCGEIKDSINNILKNDYQIFR